MSPWRSPILEYGSKTDSHFFLKCCGKSTTLLSLRACYLLIYLSTASSTSQPVSLSPVGGKEGEVCVVFPNRQCKQTKLWVNMFLTKEINRSIPTQRIRRRVGLKWYSRCLSAMHPAMATTYVSCLSQSSSCYTSEIILKYNLRCN